MDKIITIDGSIGEGGGQILRTSIALAAASNKAIRIINIRAKRKNPGLQRQHLTAVKAVAMLSNAKVKGLELGSMTLTFIPEKLRGGKLTLNIGTAGSITLVLQAILPITPFLPEPLELKITGGTDVPWSPPIDYIRFVLAPLLKRFGVEASITLKRRGHYPRGGGEIVLRIDNPKGELKAVKLIERGKIIAIEGLSHCVKLPAHVAERQANAAKRKLLAELKNIPVNISLEYYVKERDPHLGPGSGIVIWAKTERSILGGDSLGAKGKPAEQVGEEAAQKLIEDLKTGMALDRHASDMLITFAALSKGVSVLGGSRLTLHAYTNIEVVRRILPEAEIRFIKGGEHDKPFIVEVRGKPPST